MNPARYLHHLFMISEVQDLAQRPSMNTEAILVALQESQGDYHRIEQLYQEVVHEASLPD